MDAFVTYANEHNFPDAKQGTEETLLHMPAETFREFLQFLKQNHLQQCVVTGNEPVLHPEFTRLITLAKERGFSPVVETTGMVGQEAFNTLTASGCRICVKLCHPELYPPEQPFQRLVESCKKLTADEQNRDLTLRLYIDNPERDYTFIKDVCDELAPTSLVLGLSVALDPAAAQPFTTWLADHIDNFLKNGTAVRFDCRFVPCAFTEEALGRFMKRNVTTGYCKPAPGIRPDGKVYHCPALIDYAAKSFTDFTAFQEMTSYFYREWNECQNNPLCEGSCVQCPSNQTHACEGVCLLQKIRYIEKELTRLHAKPIEDLPPDELLKAGQFYFARHSWDPAEKYLLAARRADPSRGEIHLLLARVFRIKGNQQDAKNEYDKAARLMQNDQRIQAEIANLKA